MMAEPEGRVDMSINYLKTRKGMTMAGEIVSPTILQTLYKKKKKKQAGNITTLWKTLPL